MKNAPGDVTARGDIPRCYNVLDTKGSLGASSQPLSECVAGLGRDKDGQGVVLVHHRPPRGRCGAAGSRVPREPRQAWILFCARRLLDVLPRCSVRLVRATKHHLGLVALADMFGGLSKHGSPALIVFNTSLTCCACSSLLGGGTDREAGMHVETGCRYWRRMNVAAVVNYHKGYRVISIGCIYCPLALSR